jgi:hypothetical protein
MTYLYYKTSTLTSNTKPNEKTINQWTHIEGAEAAIDGSVDHFSKKLEATKGPKVVKTFE